MLVLLPSSLEWDLHRFDKASARIYDPGQELPSELRAAEAVVVWGNPSWQLEHMARSMPNLRWVQGMATGPDALIRAGFPEEVILTSGRGLHDLTVTEHALGLILACARRLHLLRDAQHRREWRADLAGVDMPRAGQPINTIFGARVVIWGFGSIAKNLGPLLKSLGAQVKGVATSSGVRAGIEVFSSDEAGRLLPECDVLVLILPKTKGTKNLVGARELALLPHHAWLVNVGRGGTLDERALLSALEEGRLAGAALDVFEEEPLPEDSPLWSQEKLIITPHSAGARPIGGAELVLRNLEKLRKGEALENFVDRERGY